MIGECGIVNTMGTKDKSVTANHGHNTIGK